MKKLNRTEIDVLKEQIVQSIIAKAEADYAKACADSDAKNLKRVTAAMAELEEHEDKVILMSAKLSKTALELTTKRTKLFKRTKAGRAECLRNLLERVRPERAEIPYMTYSHGRYNLWTIREKVNDALVLGQIDCADLNVLIKKVTRLFIS